MYHAGWLCGWINCDRLWHQQRLDAAWLCDFVMRPPATAGLTHSLSVVSELCKVWASTDWSAERCASVKKLCLSCQASRFSNPVYTKDRAEKQMQKNINASKYTVSSKLYELFSVGVVVFGLWKSLWIRFLVCKACEKHRLCFAWGPLGRKNQCSSAWKIPSYHGYFGL